jgi:hypothetical protein
MYFSITVFKISPVREKGMAVHNPITTSLQAQNCNSGRAHKLNSVIFKVYLTKNYSMDQSSS